MIFTKRLFAALAASAILLSGCGEESSIFIRTVIPADAQMKSTMEADGYQAAVIGDFDSVGYSIFTASNGKTGEDYDGLLVMRAKDEKDLEEQESETRSAEKDNIVVFVRKNDPEYGNVMVAGTESAIRAAGITLGD